MRVEAAPVDGASDGAMGGAKDGASEDDGTAHGEGEGGGLELFPDAEGLIGNSLIMLTASCGLLWVGRCVSVCVSMNEWEGG